MSLDSIFSLGQSALELGLITSLTVLALFLSYSMLNVCDLSTDGCFTLGATVGAVVAIAGHPYPSISLTAGLSSFSRCDPGIFLSHSLAWVLLPVPLFPRKR